MADIPSLDETKVSWVCSYDVTDHTSLTSINPSDMNSSGNVSNTESYDNGVVMTYNYSYGGSKSRSFTVRGSTEGWITAHLNRDNYYDQGRSGNPSTYYGTHDIVNWSRTTENNIVQNTLERAIYDCLSQLGTWSSDIEPNYNSSDVDIYNYELGSGNVSVFSDHVDPGSGYNNTYSVVYTDTTNIKQIIVSTGARHEDSSYSRRLSIDGNNIYSTYNTADYTATNATDYVQPGEKLEVTINYDSHQNLWSDFQISTIVVWE